MGREEDDVRTNNTPTDSRLALLENSGFRLTDDLGANLDEEDRLRHIESDCLVGDDGDALKMLRNMARIASSWFAMDDVARSEEGDELEVLSFRLNGNPVEIRFEYTKMAESYLAELQSFLKRIDAALDDAGLPWRFACVLDRLPHGFVERRRVILLPLSWSRELREALRPEAGLDPSSLATEVPRASEPTAYVPLPLRTPDDIIAKANRYTDDGESIMGAGSYEELVRNVAEITDGDLELHHVSCAGGTSEVFRLSVGTSRGTFAASMQGDTDWVEQASILRCLNEALEAAGASRRLYEYRPGPTQEFWLAYLHQTQVDELRTHGYVVSATGLGQ